MMVAEVIAGYVTGSMALLADGWHMASHAGAMALTWIAYQLASSRRLSKHLTFGAGKVIPLAGYTSALLLAVMAVLMAVESVRRLLSPQEIAYDEALVIAAVGLVVNLVSALILGGAGHAGGESTHNGSDHDSGHPPGHPTHGAGGHHVHDHNLKSAYFHVLADALTSILAIVALLAGRQLGLSWLDPVIGVLGAVMILRWAYGLCRETAWELLDGHSRAIGRAGIEEAIRSAGARVLDLHLWRIAPGATACELIVESSELRGSEHYRRALASVTIQHLVVEERLERESTRVYRE
jgi:cation diffusion facilitator family transporter